VLSLVSVIRHILSATSYIARSLVLVTDVNVLLLLALLLNSCFIMPSVLLPVLLLLGYVAFSAALSKFQLLVLLTVVYFNVGSNPASHCSHSSPHQLLHCRFNIIILIAVLSGSKPWSVGWSSTNTIHVPEAILACGK
jgi:hypothetical protein